MRFILVVLFGLVCLVMTSCPATDEATDDTPVVTTDETPVADNTTADVVAEMPMVCETCGNDPCTCEVADDAAVCEVCGNDPCTCEGGDMDEAGDADVADDTAGGDEAAETDDGADAEGDA